MKIAVSWLAAMAMSVMALQAADKPVMHCFAFTVIEGASPADWEAFAKATDELPGKIPGLTKVIQGKLARPLTQYQLAQRPSADDMTKLKAGEAVAAQAKMVVRQNGACMEFSSLEAFQAYAKHPAHDAWVKAYEKVRVAGTTTYQIIGQ
jgi:hypothetical protein